MLSQSPTSAMDRINASILRSTQGYFPGLRNGFVSIAVIGTVSNVDILGSPCFMIATLSYIGISRMSTINRAGQAMAREQMLEGWPPSDRAA